MKKFCTFILSLLMLTQSMLHGGALSDLPFLTEDASIDTIRSTYEAPVLTEIMSKVPEDKRPGTLESFFKHRWALHAHHVKAWYAMAQQRPRPHTQEDALMIKLIEEITLKEWCFEAYVQGGTDAPDFITASISLFEARDELQHPFLRSILVSGMLEVFALNTTKHSSPKQHNKLVRAIFARFINALKDATAIEHFRTDIETVETLLPRMSIHDLPWLNMRTGTAIAAGIATYATAMWLILRNTQNNVTPTPPVEPTPPTPPTPPQEPEPTPAQQRTEQISEKTQKVITAVTEAKDVAVGLIDRAASSVKVTPQNIAQIAKTAAKESALPLIGCWLGDPITAGLSTISNATKSYCDSRKDALAQENQQLQARQIQIAPPGETPEAAAIRKAANKKLAEEIEQNKASIRTYATLEKTAVAGQAASVATAAYSIVPPIVSTAAELAAPLLEPTLTAGSYVLGAATGTLGYVTPVLMPLAQYVVVPGALAYGGLKFAEQCGSETAKAILHREIVEGYSIDSTAKQAGTFVKEKAQQAGSYAKEKATTVAQRAWDSKYAKMGRTIVGTALGIDSIKPGPEQPQDPPQQDPEPQPEPEAPQPDQLPEGNPAPPQPSKPLLTTIKDWWNGPWFFQVPDLDNIDFGM